MLVLLVAQQNSFAQQTVIDSLEYVLKAAKEDTAKVNNLNLLCSQYIDSRDLEIAMQYADSALYLADKLDFKSGQVNAYNNIGTIFKYKSNFPEELKSVLASLEICKEIGDKKGIGKAYTSIGTIYYSQGNYSDALKNYLASLKIYEETGNKKGIASSYNNIGVINNYRGNYEEALKNHLASLKIKKEIGDKKGIASSYTNIGIAYENQANYPKAMESYFAALKIFEESGSKSKIAKIHTNLGVTYFNQGNFPKALNSYEAALKIHKELGSDLGIAINYNQLGGIHIILSNFSDARKYLDEGLAIAKKIGNKWNIQLNYENQSKLDSAEDNFALALEHYKMYTAYKDSLFNEESNNEIAQLKIQYETEKKDREIDLLNKDKELQAQQLEKQRLVRNGMMAGTVLLLLLGFFLFRSFRLRKKLEKQQAIEQERKRISADLHDDVGSGLSRIMLLSELVKKVAKKPETRKEAEKISTISQELSSNISEIIWALNSNNDYVENLVAYIRRYAAEYFENSPVKLNIHTPASLDHIHISGEHRRNVFFAVKEALHNIIKHADATEAELEFTVMNETLSVIIKDNGIGLPAEKPNPFGSGLNNMQNRMKSINGGFIIENQAGTKITLTLPV